MKYFTYLIACVFLMRSFSQNNSYAPLKTFAESLHIIETNYPKTVHKQNMIPMAIQGILSELDSYSYLMTPEQTKSFEQSHQSQFAGLGIEVISDNNQIVVTSILKNSDAFKKKIKPGDIITHVNNTDIRQLSFDQATSKIKGKIGDVVKLHIQRKNYKKPLTFQISFKKLNTPSVVSHPIGKDLLYIRIASFKDSTFREFKKILHIKDCYTKQNRLCSKSQKGLLIDVRQNSGGIIQQALLIADLFISKGTLITMKGKSDIYNQTFQAKEIGTFQPAPIVILIDHHSASASEVLVASLQENHIAFVVGRKSFGKGSIQTIFNLNDGYSLKLTVSHYYTPNGNSIEDIGIQPMIHIQPNQIFQFSKKHQSSIQQWKNKFYANQHQKSDSPSINTKNTWFQSWQTMIKKDPQLQVASSILKKLIL